MKLKNKYMKLMIIFIALVTLLSIGSGFTITAIAADEEIIGDFVVKRENPTNPISNITIIGYKGDSEKVEIPSSMEGARVKAVGANAFEGNTAITAVTIPETVYSIGKSAFKDCTNLSSITFSDYAGWEKANNSRTWDNLHIDENAFTGCIALKTVDFPYGIYLYKNAFTGSGLEEAKVTMSIWSQISGGFDGCEYLKTITIDDRESTEDRCIFRQGCFSDLPKLEEVDVYGAERVYFGWEKPEADNLSSFVNCPKLTDVNLYYESANNASYSNFYYDSWEEGHEACILISSDTSVVEVKHKAEYTIVGKGKATLTGPELRFQINIFVGETKQKDLNDCKIILAKSSYAKTGENIKARVSVIDGDVLLSNGVDYTLSYSNDNKLGTAYITISGKGDYEGTVKKSYKIVPLAPALNDVSVSGKKIKLTWNEVFDSDGYVVYYSDTKSGKYVELTTVKGKNSYTSDKLALGIYVKIRSYKIVDGVKYYSAYSAVELL